MIWSLAREKIAELAGENGFSQEGVRGIKYNAVHLNTRTDVMSFGCHSEGAESDRRVFKYEMLRFPQHDKKR
jgi:hypothetical protein